MIYMLYKDFPLSKYVHDTAKSKVIKNTFGPG